MTSKGRTATDMGEMEIVGLFKELWRSRRSILQKYDDAWAFKKGRTFVTVSTDMLVESTDVPPGMTYELAARKAVVMSSSDIASKGHSPAYHLASLGIRTSTTSREVRKIRRGIGRGIKECGGWLVGGDTNEAKELILSATTIGIGETKPVPRTLGKEGDVIATTGRFGGPPAGLMILFGRSVRRRRVYDGFIDSVLRPRAHVKEGVALARASALSGSTDSSDGLSASLHNMILNSGRGALIERVPYVNHLEDFAEENRKDALDLALNGGEEYNLVLSVKRSMWNKALTLAEEEGFELYRLGRVVPNRGLWILDTEGKRRAVGRGGWLHFRGKGE